MRRIIELSAMDAAEQLKLLKELGERITKIRKERGLSVRDLAEIAGMGYTNVNNIENGKINPQYITLIVLAEALEVDPCTLLSPK